MQMQSSWADIFSLLISTSEIAQIILNYKFYDLNDFVNSYL